MFKYLKEEKIYGNNTFYEYISNMKIGIWGVGSGLERVKSWLDFLDIKEMVYFDSDPLKRNGQIFSPSYLKDKNEENWFIIIASSYYNEIKKQLETYGFQEYANFINGLDIEDSIYSYKYKDCIVPELNFEDLDRIEKDMRECNINIVDINIDIDDVNKFAQYFNLDEIYDKKNNKRYFRKIIEYYIAYTLLDLKSYSKKDIYVDVGACLSPWAKILNEKSGINSYAIDLEKSKLFSDLDYYIINDATNTEFSDNSISSMSLQSSYEMFINDNDIRFIEECARILKPGGKIIISPLYMNKEYISTSSPKYYRKGYSDLYSKEYVRYDSKEIYFARLYDVEKLRERVLKTIIENGMQYRIYVLSNEQVEKDGFIYLKFILEIEKKGDMFYSKL